MDMSWRDGPSFVGRHAELRRLGHAIEAVKHGDGQAFMIIGQAGIGRTRLAAEVGRLAAKAGLRVLQGRATRQPIAYRALSEALLCAVREASLPDDPALMPYRAALSRLLPELARGQRRQATDSPVAVAEAVLRLLTRIVEPQGCVVILDDLHHADEDTLAVVEYLSDNLAGAGTLLLATIRAPGGAAQALALRLAQRGAAALVELGGLDDSETDNLAAGIMGVPVEALPKATLDRLRTETLGVPLYVEVACEMAPGGVVPARMVHHASTLAAGLGPAGATFLRAACILGHTFRLSVVTGVAELGGGEVISGLRAAVAAGIVAATGDPDRYAFRHALVREALRAGLLPPERAELAQRAARTVERSRPGRSREICELAAEMWLEAGDVARAASLLYRAGRLAMTHGATEPASSLLGRGLGLAQAVPGGAEELIADLVDALLDLHLRMGRVRLASDLVDRYSLGVDRPRRAARHGRLARAHVHAERWNEARFELRRARSLVGEGADVETLAPLDAVEAHLTDGDPAADPESASIMAQRALHAATTAELPAVACEALEVLGNRAQPLDVAEAQQHYERALEIATEHGLPDWQARVLYRLGAHDADRSGAVRRLTEAHELASAAGAAVTRLNVDAKLAMVRLAEGGYDEAERLAQGCCDRSGQVEYPQLGVAGLGIRVCAAAHRGRRAEVQPLLKAFRECGGEHGPFGPAVWGFGLACCSLLEEDRDRAFDELAHALTLQEAMPRRPSLAQGLHLLLGTLRGSAGWPEYKAVTASPWAAAPWNHRLILLSSAVLHGRQGRTDRAAAMVEEFAAVPVCQPLAHHLGLRLVAEAAVADGWLDPAPWLREAETYFRMMSVPAVVAACHALMRRCGARVPQQRDGSAEIPPALRRLGVTVREHEVLKLLGAELSTRDIARRLFLSPRTVEKHVANLLAKTGWPDRAALARFAAGSR